MQIEKIIGQQEIKKHLVEMVQHNGLGLVLLFLGKEGSGALLLALALAQYVVCEKVNSQQPKAQVLDEGSTNSPPDSCGTCPACLKAVQLIHPDIHFSYPVVTKKS